MLEMMKNNEAFKQQMASKFFTPIETFDVFNDPDCSIAAEDFSNESENLPLVETWKVYPYIALGCLEDIFVNYFNHPRKSQKTLESAVKDIQARQDDKNQLYNLCLNLGAELCQVAENLSRHLLADKSSFVQHQKFQQDFSKLINTYAIYVMQNDSKGMQMKLKLKASANLDKEMLQQGQNITDKIADMMNSLIERLGGFEQLEFFTDEDGSLSC